MSIYVCGAGGHGVVVAEAAEAAGLRVLGFLDDVPSIESIGKWPVRAVPAADAGAEGVIVAIGDNMARRRITSDIVQSGLRLVSVIHPTAHVSPSALIGQGVYIGPQAVINAQARVENGVIINSGAIVEHHVVVGAFANLGPGAVLAGRVQVGALAMIGAGAAVKPDIRIGDDCKVGVGAAVVADVEHGRTVAGVPARPVH